MMNAYLMRLLTHFPTRICTRFALFVICSHRTHLYLVGFACRLVVAPTRTATAPRWHVDPPHTRRSRRLSGAPHDDGSDLGLGIRTAFKKRPAPAAFPLTDNGIATAAAAFALQCLAAALRACAPRACALTHSPRNREIEKMGAGSDPAPCWYLLASVPSLNVIATALATARALALATAALAAFALSSSLAFAVAHACGSRGFSPPASTPRSPRLTDVDDMNRSTHG